MPCETSIFMSEEYKKIRTCIEIEKAIGREESRSTIKNDQENIALNTTTSDINFVTNLFPQNVEFNPTTTENKPITKLLPQNTELNATSESNDEVRKPPSTEDICENTYQWRNYERTNKIAVNHPNTSDETKLKNPNIDGGWGWVVLLGAFYIGGCSMSFVTCFGILFSQKIMDFGVSSTTISVIFTVHNIMRNIGVILTNSLINKFGIRCAAFVGSLIASVAFLLIAFAFSTFYVFVMYSVILAISGGVITTICFLIVPQYFVERRGFAMAVFMTGMSTWGMVTPVLIRTFQDHYGFFGATLLQGGVIANCCVFASLFRAHKKRGSNVRNGYSKDEENKVSLHDIERNSALENENEKEIGSYNNLLLPDEQIAGTENRTKSYASTHSQSIDSSFTSKFQNTKNSIFAWIKEHFHAMKKLSVLLISFSYASFLLGHLNYVMLVPFAVEHAGHSPQFSAWCITMIGITNTCTRALVSCMADRRWLNRKSVCIFGALGSSVCVVVFACVTWSEKWMTVSSLCYGVAVGLFLSLYYTNLIDVLGMELYPISMGVGAIVLIFSMATIGPCIGIIRDVFSSYKWSLFTCAALHLIAGLLMMPLRSRPVNRRSRAAKDDASGPPPARE